MWTQSISKEAFLVNFLINAVQFLTYVCLFCLLLFFTSVILLVLSGDIETNPGPDPGYSISFSCCHWNLNNIAPHNVNSSLLSFGSRRVCLVRIYRTPSQSSNEYDTFLLNFEQLLTYLNSIKPHVLLVKGDFNLISSSWWFNDIDAI